MRQRGGAVGRAAWCRGSASMRPPALQILRREQPQQRAAAREHGAALRRRARRFEQDLRGAGRHHARQGPARNRERPLQRAGREMTWRAWSSRARRSRGDADLQLGRDVPDAGAGRVLARRWRGTHRRASRRASSRRRGLPRPRRRLSRCRDRSARRARAARRGGRYRCRLRRGRRRASPAGPAPTMASIAFAHPLIGPASRLPRWRLDAHALAHRASGSPGGCRRRRSSTRHSKHTPIMQIGPARRAGHRRRAAGAMAGGEQRGGDAVAGTRRDACVPSIVKRDAGGVDLRRAVEHRTSWR